MRHLFVLVVGISLVVSSAGCGWLGGGWHSNECGGGGCGAAMPHGAVVMNGHALPDGAIVMDGHGVPDGTVVIDSRSIPDGAIVMNSPGVSSASVIIQVESTPSSPPAQGQRSIPPAQ
jgi:hypothetical protein